MDHRYNISKTKNCADIALVVDATASLYGGGPCFDTIVVISSDSDFGPLALQARECGKVVVGMGSEKTPSSYVGLCKEFHLFDKLEA